MNFGDEDTGNRVSWAVCKYAVQFLNELEQSLRENPALYLSA